MGYPNRRYCVVDGKIAKRWDGTSDPEWHMTKAEAWEAEGVKLKKAADAKRTAAARAAMDKKREERQAAKEAKAAKKDAAFA